VKHRVLTSDCPDRIRRCVTGALIAICVLTAGAWPAAAVEAAPAGRMKLVQGHVWIMQGDGRVAAETGLPVYPGDIVATEAHSSASIFLTDNTSLTLGPESHVSVKEYEFEPQASSFKCVIRCIQGTFGYLSGIMARLAPDTIRIETPDSTIGIRGTHLLIKVLKKE